LLLKQTVSIFSLRMRRNGHVGLHHSICLSICIYPESTRTQSGNHIQRMRQDSETTMVLNTANAHSNMVTCVGCMNVSI